MACARAWERLLGTDPLERVLGSMTAQDWKGELGRRKSNRGCKGDDETATVEVVDAWVGREVANWFLCPYAEIVSARRALVSSRKDMLSGQGIPLLQTSPNSWGPRGSYL